MMEFIEGKTLDQLLATKFFVPASPRALISRPRLSALLKEGLQRKLTLLSAPAGIGKTTLVSTGVQSRAEEDAPVAWFSLYESDNDPACFWSYLLTALDASYQGIGQQALAHLRAPKAPPIQYVLTTLINAMTTRAAPCLLILDDYHVITEQAIHDAFRFLLEHQPGYLHVFLLTRFDPPFLLSRLRALGQILELRCNQLRFTPQEAATFLTQAMGLSLEAEVVQAVETRTEGWIASLQLAALSTWADRPNRPARQAAWRRSLYPGLLDRRSAAATAYRHPALPARYFHPGAPLNTHPDLSQLDVPQAMLIDQDVDYGCKEFPSSAHAPRYLTCRTSAHYACGECGSQRETVCR